MNEPRARTAPLALVADGSPSARDAVIGALLEEHRTLGTVLAMMQRLLNDTARRGTAPDFPLLCSALYYISEFPERVHHRKEDDHLFAALRRRTANLNDVLHRLSAEHVRSPQMLARIERELVHYQGGAPEGLQRLISAVTAYSDMLGAHMRTEEEVFAAARVVLTEEDWIAIRRAFEPGGDPLLSEEGYREFRRLRARILNLLPSKLRLSPGATEALRPRSDRLDRGGSE